jgi:hypothetical protein
MRDALFFFVLLTVAAYLGLSLIQWNLNIPEWSQIARFVLAGVMLVPAIAFATSLWEAMTEGRR